MSDSSKEGGGRTSSGQEQGGTDRPPNDKRSDALNPTSDEHAATQENQRQQKERGW
jgi:hypothetical protein